MTDNAGNTYVSANAHSSEVGTLGGGSSEIWYAVNSKPGATTINFNACQQEAEFYELEISGASTTSPLTGAAVLNDQPETMTLAAPKVMTSATNSFVISIERSSQQDGSVSSTAPFIGIPAIINMHVDYYFADSPGSYGAVWTARSMGTYGSSTVIFGSEP
jgi:hypothetical protein